jgi:tetratricopeptide (TPR) repeat protein
MTIIDPWLTSAEISISTIKGRTSKLIKRGIELINSKNVSPFNFTELASSIGTVELLYGGAKKSREFFNKSLISPNDNSLAQIEWASTKDKALDIDPSLFGVKMNFEALALDNFQNRDYNTALDNAAKWFIDMPFSKRPIMFGSNLASTILKDQQKAISFLNAGLISHPNDPQLINNLAYSLALDNKPKDAFLQLDKIRNEESYDDITRICLTATRGLSYFRSGFIDTGRKLYLEAIEQTKQIKNRELNWIAILNYAREEINLKSEYVEPIMEVVAKIPDNTKDYEISVLKRDVVDLHKKLKVQS